jgi:hypothetical protein
MHVFAAPSEKLANIHGFVAADRDVVATGAERITGLDRNKAFTRMTGNLQATGHAPAMQVAIVQFVLSHDVAL